MNTELSRWWRYGVALVALGGLGVLLWITLNTYSGDVGAPIPTRVVDEAGQTVFTGADIIAGQQVFQKHALMENGAHTYERTDARGAFHTEWEKA